jgi:hypothetical protein
LIEIRYIGLTHFCKTDTLFGIDVKVGNNRNGHSGNVDEVNYFEVSEPGAGVFVSRERNY